MKGMKKRIAFVIGIGSLGLLLVGCGSQEYTEPETIKQERIETEKTVDKAVDDAVDNVKKEVKKTARKI